MFGPSPGCKYIRGVSDPTSAAASAAGSAVCGVVVSGKGYVDGVGFTFCDGTNSTFMGSGVPVLVLSTTADDPITRVVIQYGDWIDNLQFVTRSGKTSLAVGGGGGGKEVVDFPMGLYGAEGAVCFANVPVYRYGFVCGIKWVYRYGCYYYHHHYYYY